VIAGKILDERGDPVAGVQVAALKRTAGNTPTTAVTTDTDDRGEYRLAGLSDGAFVVGVTTLAAVGLRPSGRIADPRTTYYPAAATVDEAQTLRLQPGDERLGADIIVTAERLAGMPSGLFANRFLPREPSPLVRLGLEQPASSPTGSVRGRVVGVDGTPIPFAQVYLFAATNADSRMATTDGDGRFDVEKIVAGTLLVSVAKQGYLQVESGQTVRLFQMGRAVTSPSPTDPQFGRRLELAADERRSVDLQLARWGTVSGTITDEYGDPMQGVAVEVLHVDYEAGRRRLVFAGASRVTDDLGRYRLHGLAPGRYVLSAAVGQVGSDDLPGYARTYFPGTPSTAEAQYVSVGLAQDVEFSDFSMSKARTARVTGIVLGPAGEPTAAGTLTLAPSRRSSSITSVAVGARIARNGTFVFPNVAPGEYVIKAYRGRSNAHTEGEFGAVLVSVNLADVTGVTVRTSSGSSIAGRLRFERDNLTIVPKPSDFELVAIPVDFDLSPPVNMGNAASADIHANWTFEMAAQRSTASRAGPHAAGLCVEGNSRERR
jgi:protocatechuate 3,4-dioxygenase beta subunit